MFRKLLDKEKNGGNYHRPLSHSQHNILKSPPKTWQEIESTCLSDGCNRRYKALYTFLDNQIDQEKNPEPWDE